VDRPLDRPFLQQALQPVQRVRFAHPVLQGVQPREADDRPHRVLGVEGPGVAPTGSATMPPKKLRGGL